MNKRITLIRHGEPKLDETKRVNASGFKKWINQYNAAGLIDVSKPTADTLKIAEENSIVFCSELRRSIESAKKLTTQNNIIRSDTFNEADMPCADWQYLKLSPPLWAIIFRIAWRFGYSNDDTESYIQAVKRSKKATNKLIQQTEETGHAILVGHGIFNRLIASQLKQCGWSFVKPLESTYWGHGILERDT